jgi:glycosyltransferase involved in cell wall biosynthesis
MRVLVISTMYPNRTQPVHAVFVEQRIRAMAKRFPVRVVCPVPWFPILGRLPRYAHRRRIARREERFGIRVDYPRFLSFPLILKPLDGPFLFLRCLALARRLRREFPFDRIDAHLAYPDGWGAVLLGRLLRVPVSVTLRGHDLNDLPRYPVRRRQVAWTLRAAGAVFAVADALREAAVALGAPAPRTRTVGNGVDVDRFAPLPRDEARRTVGLAPDGPVVLSVGHLVERKGFHHLVRAFREVVRAHPAARLVILGGPGEEGDATALIRRAVTECGLEERVSFPGVVPNEELAPWYAAADVFCLASGKEGRPNVLLEALACGTPVVATRVWGSPEIVSDDSLGILVESVDAAVLGAALGRALATDWDRDRLATHARGFSWDAAAETVERALAALGGEEAPCDPS